MKFQKCGVNLMKRRDVYLELFFHKARFHIPKVILSILSGVVRSTLMLLPTMMLQRLINSVTGDQAQSANTAVYGVLYVLCPLIVLVLYVLDTWLSRFVYDIIKEIRLDTIKKVVQQPTRWVSETSHQEIYNKIIHGSLVIADFYFSTLSNLVWYTTTIVVGFIFMAQINAPIAILLIAVSIFQIFGAQLLKKPVETANRQKNEALIEGNSIASDSIYSSAYLRVLGLGEYVEQSESTWQKHYTKAVNKMFSMNALADIQTALCEIIRIVILLVFSQRGVQSGEMLVGDIYAMNAYILWLTPVFFGIQRWFISLFVSIGNQKRMDDILLLPERNQEEAGRKCENVTSLELDDVKFQYEETGKCLFDHLSYRFASGDTVVIRGNSGSGKTSLLKLLLRFEKPTAGEIKINGNDIESYDERSFREQVSVASQSTEFLACSIRDNLLLSGANHTDDEIIETLSLLELDKLIEKLPEGLDTIVSSETVAFSDGEKKRMGIARALLSNASVLIFDEPTASLDNKTKGPIMESIRNQCKNRILIVVTHDEKIVQPTDIQINIGE